MSFDLEISPRAKTLAVVVDALARRQPGVSLGKLILQAVGDWSPRLHQEDKEDRAGLRLRLENITDTELVNALKGLLA